MVGLALTFLDPDGVERHKKHKSTRMNYTNKKTNYLWHLDRNNKLKLFGVGIHGCIDGSAEEYYG